MKYLRMKNYFVIVLLVTAMADNIHAKSRSNEIARPNGFTAVETILLDEAWVNPSFNSNDFKTVSLVVDEFDFREVKQRYAARRHIMNYELTELEKEKLVEKTESIFNQYFDKMQNYQNIDVEKANAQTMVVKIRLIDFVNKVPSLRQTDGFTQLYLRQFGAATLHIEIWSNQDDSLLFTGYVREDIEPIGRALEKANTINARHQTYLQLNRWAKGLRKELDAM